MFETTLPYPVFDADNHFYDAEDVITRHLERSFVDAGKVAVDYRPDTVERHRKKMQEELGNAFGVPGSHTYKANPLRIADPDEREKVVQSFRLMAPVVPESREPARGHGRAGSRSRDHVPVRCRRVGRG